MKKLFTLIAMLALGISGTWAEDETVTIPCASSIAIVGTGPYATPTDYEKVIYLNSYAPNGGAGAASFTLDDNFDASKVKSAKLKFYVVSKPTNKNRSGNIYIKSLTKFPTPSTTYTSYSDGKHLVYSYGGTNTKRYAYTETAIATYAASSLSNSAPTVGSYFDVDITNTIKGMSSAKSGDVVYFGIDISDWVADMKLGAYGNDNAPKLEIVYSSASQANYTVKYVCESEEIKDASTHSGDVDGTPTLTDADKEACYNDDASIKYVYASDNTSTTTIASDGSTVVTVNFTACDKWTCTASATDGTNTIATNIASGSTYTDTKKASFYIPAAVEKDNKLYFTTNEDYYKEATLTANGEDVPFTYNTSTVDNVVFFAEGEKLDGATSVTPTGVQKLVSCGYVGKGQNLPLTTLSPGIYQITFKHYTGNSSQSASISAGENAIYTSPEGGITKGRGTINTDEFTLTESTALTMTIGGGSISGVDYIYIVKTGDVPSATMSCAAGKLGTFCAPFDVTLPTDVKAYSATSTSEAVNLTKIADGGATLNAGTPAIIYNEGSDAVSETFYGVSTVTDATKTVGALTGMLTSNAVPQGSYVLQTSGDVQSFYYVSKAAVGSLNRCYVTPGVSTAKGSLAIVFDDYMPTAVANVEAADAADNGVKKYMKAGQLVIKTAKGMFNAAGQQVK